MIGFLASVLSAIMSLSSNVPAINIGTQDTTRPIETYHSQACYTPDLNDKITLTWDNNFQNVKDYRAKLNPKFWGGESGGGTAGVLLNRATNDTFNTDASCKTLPMNNLQQRTFILVRRELRVPSCKTDEMVGPGRDGNHPNCYDRIKDMRPGFQDDHRGTCDYGGYTDLRKIADATDTKSKMPLEIFWTPFSHNVGCGYQKEGGSANCGSGDNTNLNLKDFIYVLTGRDAYAPDFKRNNCPSRWDAGATDSEACSHYFKIYMAKDLFDECYNAKVDPKDMHNKCYFFKQVVQNCHEDTIAYPVIETNFQMPPQYLKRPFPREANVGKAGYFETGKIIPNPNTPSINLSTNTVETAAATKKYKTELESYKDYIWGVPGGTIINPGTTNLMRALNKEGEAYPPFDYCIKPGSSSTEAAGTTPTPKTTPTPTSAFPTLPKCLESIGTIALKDKMGASVSFGVYSRRMAPETFFLINKGDPKIGYVYETTEKDPPTNDRNDPSLQLRKMEMITKNQWTWGTPVCKPAIYLYPEKETDLNVKLKLSGELTKSEPAYSADSGWNVRAKPNGTLQLTTDNLQPTTYPYLYYEADVKGVTIPKEGWIVENSNLKTQISKVLEKVGFNGKEISDFMEYWLPRLKEKPYYFVTLIPESVINQKEELIFSKTPNTLIRTRVVFEGLDNPVSVAPLANISSHTRHGFVVTDWGGTIVGEDCHDVSVK